MSTADQDRRPRVVYGKAGTSTEGRAFIATVVTDPASAPGPESAMLAAPAGLDLIETELRDAGGSMLREAGRFRIWGFPKSMPVSEVEALCERLLQLADAGSAVEAARESLASEPPRDAVLHADVGSDPAPGHASRDVPTQRAEGQAPETQGHAGSMAGDLTETRENDGADPVAAATPDHGKVAPPDGADQDGRGIGREWISDLSTAPRGKFKTVSGKAAGRESAAFERQVHVREKIFAAGSAGVVTVGWWLPDEERWCMFTKGVPPIAWMPWEENAPLPQHPCRVGQKDLEDGTPVLA